MTAHSDNDEGKLIEQRRIPNEQCTQVWYAALLNRKAHSLKQQQQKTSDISAQLFIVGIGCI